MHYEMFYTHTDTVFNRIQELDNTLAAIRYLPAEPVWLKCEKPGFSVQADVSIQQAPIKCKLKG